MTMREVDPWQWLEGGELPAGDPARREEALRICRFIEYGAGLHPLFGRETLMECRSAAGAGCLGLIWVEKTPANAIRAFCATCEADEMLIVNWQRTHWSFGVMAPVPM